ncbi:IMP and pyridine-specific 5'-nucleotidase [Marchantia polymorpha subsp. ruderalis]|uniref:IMP-specific 5'-nucleotidase 1 n=2 Tax=Marchantia polymorpha TaxID=3197 RepID=A0AAF6B0N2_MARPO|nr:hypothetical protein MARPO_0004s0249 [Marchantia polymorpha]BBN05566.1 hypothetical protein Mp_3g14220 [Marchantia polymorpha subsp. ruderalis]|eukprot:PTQ49016.1 hypothetical protein MARPO_0004s0249 [Marchantia polymorpha]
MAAASSCGCPPLVSSCAGDFGKRRLEFAVGSSVRISPCRLHSAHSALLPVFRGSLRGGRNCEESGSRAVGSESLLGLLALKPEESFGSFGELRCGRGEQRRGERCAIVANVVSRTGVSTLEGNQSCGSGIFETEGEVQHQDRDGAVGGPCREHAAPPAVSSNGSVTADVEVEVAEELNSGKELDPQLESRESVVETGEEKNRTGNGTPSSSKSGMRWSMLLSTAALEDAHLSRASSVTDAHVLRRKGRLKEQDGLIEFIISMHNTHSPFQVMEKVERWIREHLEDPKRSTLARLVPSVGRFYTPLPLVRALQEYDEFASLSRRRYVPPNFAEIRHVLNIAQVHAIAGQLSLITFDADGTLYADGHHIQRDNKMIDHIIKLMQEGCHVAIVTAAGYPGDSCRYEDRLAGLLAAFKDLELPPRITQLFHVMGGECNYLLRVTKDYRLDFVPDELWQTRDMQEWSQSDVQKLLEEAEASLVSAAARLRLPVELIRKPKAVGAIPKEPTIYEVLEEMALTVQMQLIDSKLPYCAFNGGNDVFVDVGNKSVGLEALMKFLRKGPKETLHVGDRFTLSGNDSATRSKCSILWVANPEETGFFTRVLLREVQLSRLIPYIE